MPFELEGIIPTCFLQDFKLVEDGVGRDGVAASVDQRTLCQDSLIEGLLRIAHIWCFLRDDWYVQRMGKGSKQ